MFAGRPKGFVVLKVYSIELGKQDGMDIRGLASGSPLTE